MYQNIIVTARGESLPGPKRLKSMFKSLIWKGKDIQGVVGDPEWQESRQVRPCVKEEWLGMNETELVAQTR